MAANKRPTPDDIDIVTLFASIRRSLGALAFAALIIGAATYGILSTISPRYGAEAQLSVSAKRTNPFPDKRDNAGSLAPRLDKEAINTHVRSLMAPDLVRNVADSLQLKSRPEFNSALGPVDLWSRAWRTIGLGGPRPGESDEERVLAVVYQQLQVSAAKESRFISINFSSVEPKLSAEFVNKLAASYRDGLVSAPVKETAAVVTALRPKVEQLRKEVFAAEAEAESFRAKTDQFRAGPQNTPINNARMSALTAELTKVETARSEAESRWRTAQQLSRTGSADILPDVQKSPIVQNLINQRVAVEREYAEASASLLPDHPRMRQLSANLRGLKRQVSVEVAKVVASLGKDYQATSLRVDAVQKQIDALKAKVVKTSPDEAKLRALESAAKSKRAELERLQKQLEDNRTLINTRQVPVEAQIVSLARASSTAVFPKKGPYAALAAVATFLLGLAWTVFRELVAGAYGASTSQRRPSHGNPPSHRPAHQDPVMPIPMNMDAQLATIASKLALREGVQNGYRTLIAGDAKSIEAVTIAIAEQLVARAQSTVVVDWSPSGDGAFRYWPSTAPGMTELLEDRATFEEIVRKRPGSDVQFISSGAPVVDPDVLLEPNQMNLVLDVLDEAYDHVIIAGRPDDAQHLFKVVEGRFDAGIRVLDEDSGRQNDARPGHFLGYDVEGIDVHVCHAGRVRQPDTIPAAPSSASAVSAAN